MAVLLRRRGGGGNVGLGTNNEGSAWVQAVAANGGVVTASRALVVERFIAAEKAAGTWDLTDDYWALWGENAPQALTSLKQRRLATAVAAPNFTADSGYLFNGTTSYVNTGFVPSTHAVVMTGTSARLAVYERTNLDSAGASAGSNTGAAQCMQIYSRTGTSLFGRIGSNANIGFTLTVVDSRGYSATSLAGTLVSDTHSYKNGVELVRVVSAPTMGNVLPTFAVFIGGSNSGGSFAGPRASTTGFACIGAALTPAQELAQYNNVQAWAVAVGANV